jgi:hypothetical protein
MSLGNSLKNLGGVQEILVLALMMVSMFALFYADISLTYKISIAIIAFAIIFLSTLAVQVLRQQKETKQK